MTTLTFPQTTNYLNLCILPCVQSATNCALDDVPCLCRSQNNLESLLRATPCWIPCRGYAENANEYLGLLCRDYEKARGGVVGAPAPTVIVVGSASSRKRSSLGGLVVLAVLLLEVLI